MIFIVLTVVLLTMAIPFLIWHLLASKIDQELNETDPDEILASLWLYVDWRYCTKQLTTPQKEYWADCVDYWWAKGENGPVVPVADRWWR
jgi:hypothetical protein